MGRELVVQIYDDTSSEVHRRIGILIHRETLVGEECFTDIVLLEEEACPLETKVSVGIKQRCLASYTSLCLKSELLMGRLIVGCVVGTMPVSLHAQVYSLDLSYEEAQVDISRHEE